MKKTKHKLCKLIWCKQIALASERHCSQIQLIFEQWQNNVRKQTKGIKKCFLHI